MDTPNGLSLVVYVPNKVDRQEFSSTSSTVQGIPPLNAYEIDLMKPVVKKLTLQMDIYIQELKELEEPKDPEHMIAMVAFENVANKVEKKRGRKAKSKVIGPISVNFELPDEYFDNNDIQRVLATRPPTKFSALERRMNWKMHLTKRVDNRRYDAHFLHLPSNIIFRSKKEVAYFLLCEHHPSNTDNNTSKKRKRNAMNYVRYQIC